MAQKAKARALRPFYDKAARRRREAGEVFECTARRLAEINGTAAGELAAKVQPAKDDADGADA